MNVMNCCLISLGCDLTDLTEAAIFDITLQKQQIKVDIFSIDQVVEGRFCT